MALEEVRDKEEDKAQAEDMEGDMVQVEEEVLGKFPKVGNCNSFRHRLFQFCREVLVKDRHICIGQDPKT